MKRLIILLVSYTYISFSLSAQFPRFILDTTFNTFNNTSINTVRTFVKQSNKLVIGGLFDKVAGKSCNNICRLLNDSVVDPDFIIGTGFNNEVKKIIVLPTDKMYVMGAFTSYSNVNINYLIRLNANGTPDLTFVPNFDNGSVLQDFVVQSDGMLVVIGSFNTYSGYSRKNIVRLKSNGSLDLAFNSGNANNGVFNKVLLQSNGKIILSGEFNKHISTTVSSIVRLLNTGDVDNSFVCNLAAYDNKVVLTDIFLHPNDDISIPRNDAYPQSFSRYNSEGTLLNNYTFTVSPKSLLLGNGNFLSNIGSGSNGIELNEYSTNGSIIKKYKPNGWYISYDFSYGPVTLFSMDNNIYMGCNYYENYTPATRTLIRLSGTDAIDYHFLPVGGPNFSITDLAKHSTNKYVVIGGFSRIGTANVKTIAMIDSNCVVDRSFSAGEGFNGPALCLAIQANGRIIIGGDFTTYNNQPAPHIIRLMPDGSIDPTFNVGAGFDFPVYDIEIINTDEILLAGVFGQYQSVEVSNIICLNSDGSMNTAFNTNIGAGSNGRIRKIHKAESNIYLIGDFNYFNGNLSKHIARINYSGIYDNTFNAGQADNGSLNDAVELNGKLYVTGDFTMYNNSPIRSIAKLNLDGTNVPLFYDTQFYGASVIPGINMEVVSNALVFAGAKSTTTSMSSFGYLSTSYYAAAYYEEETSLYFSKNLFQGQLNYIPEMSADSANYYFKHLKLTCTEDELFVFGVSIGDNYNTRGNFIVRYRILPYNSSVTTDISNSSTSTSSTNLYLVVEDGELMLHDGNNSKGSLQIFDLNGTAVLNQDYQTNTFISTDGIKSGMYIIKYMDEDQNIKTIKVILN